jgi:cyanophycinase-like exopeptidase
MIAVLGSGETSLAGGRVFETIASRLAGPPRVAILETPAGFELNSAQVAGRVGDFLKSRLKNFGPRVEVIPARKRGTSLSPDDPGLLASLADANLIFMGPGSPTYAVRQLEGSLAWDLLRARHRRGAALVFASAATIAVGAWALPVYEIFKAGEEVRAVPGLDLFADFGLALSFIPHWNNTDGGADVDTSRCFVGMERFAQWCAQLPPGQTTIGLDEHTALVIDFEGGRCQVSGVSSVSLLRECDPLIFPARAEFPLTDLGALHWSEGPRSGISPRAWEMATQAVQEPEPGIVPEEVARLAEQRLEARRRKDWAASDALRQQIAGLGWEVQDGPGDQVLRKSSDS